MLSKGYMKRLKTFGKFGLYVEFPRCMYCTAPGRPTDLFCVCCEEWRCEEHVTHCSECELPVCNACHTIDRCCFVRPEKKIEKHMNEFYKEKLVDGGGLFVCALQSEQGKHNGSKWNELRKKVVERSVMRFVDDFDASFASHLRWNPYFVPKCFPRIEDYVKDEETQLKFLDFLREISQTSYVLFTDIIVYSEDREQLLSMTEDFIRNDFRVLEALFKRSMEYEEKKLFESLKERGLIHAQGHRCYFLREIGHIEAFLWLEAKGINFFDEKKFFSFPSVEIQEFLLTERGVSIEFLLRGFRKLRLENLKMIFRIRGLKAVQNLTHEINFDFETVKYLKCIGYSLPLERKRKDLFFNLGKQCYIFVCCNVLKFEDLSEQEREKFREYVSNFRIKVCKKLFSFLSKTIQQKVMTVFCCVKRLNVKQKYFTPKEIVWMILDLTYSPASERGAL